MANIKIGMMLTDDTNSINKRTNSAKALNKELEKTQTLSKTALGGAPDAAQVVQYNRQRAVGGTGAGARDFAKQAEGLGGIVRLYATFAANIFAVGAAFQALNRAAQMERLVQASEMMTQRVGVNLKGLGRDLQEATGYALSFEQSMQFANIGTSAGIAASDLKELVTIAKGAAAGLGRDVNDSITRIIQGTAKQEQEILDELGIFIKAKDAYEEYARKFQIEGGPDALSAQQRVRAYSDAVKQAGQQWKEFAKIPDPFAELTARGSEAINEILKNVNQIVVPVLELLAKSGDAIKALIVLLAGTLVKRALPEVAAGLTQIFTFDSTRAKAEATKARQAIISEYNAVTAELKAAKSVRDKLLMETPGGVTTALGGMVAARATKTDPGNVGISAQRLTTAIFGTTSKPVDITKYKDVEDINKKILSTLKAQVTASKEQADVLVNNLIKNKVLEANSTRENLILSQQTRTVGQDIYNDLVTKRIKAQTDVVNLTQREVDLNKQMQGFQQGVTAAIVARQRAGTAAASPGGTTAAAAGAAAAAATAVSLREAFGAGLGQVGDRSRQLATQLDQGAIKSLKAFGSAIKDNLVSIKTAGDGLSGMARVAAGAGAAVGTLGTVVSGAFRLIGAAFGPLLIMFTLWEMFGDKIIPKSVTKMKELEDKTRSLYQELDNVSKAVDNATLSYAKSNQTVDSYLKYIQIVNTSLRSQKRIIEELIEAELDKQRVMRGEKPRTEEEREVDITQKAIDVATARGAKLDPAIQTQLNEVKARIKEGLQTTEERNRKLRAQAEADRELLLSYITATSYMSTKAEEAGTPGAFQRFAESAGFKNMRELVDQVQTGTEKGRAFLEAVKQQQFSTLATGLASGDPSAMIARSEARTLVGTPQQFFERRLSPEGRQVTEMGQSQSRVQNLTRLAELSDSVLTTTESIESRTAAVSTSFSNATKAVSDMRQNLLKLPKFTNIAKTSEGLPVEDAFNDLFKALDSGGASIGGIKNSTVDFLNTLKDAGIEGAGTLAEQLGKASDETFPQEAKNRASQFKSILEKINQVTSDYTEDSRKGFVASTASIESQKQAIQKSAIAQGDLNEKMAMYDSILGTVPQDLLNDQLKKQIDLNQRNLDLSITQAALERDRVVLKRDAKEEDKNAANAAYNAAVQQANITKQIADIEAERVKRAKELSNELSIIAKKYEDIALRQGAGRSLEDAREELRRAYGQAQSVGYSPTMSVEMDFIDKAAESDKNTTRALEDLQTKRQQDFENIITKAGISPDFYEKISKEFGASTAEAFIPPEIQQEIDRLNKAYYVQTQTARLLQELGQKRLEIEKGIAESAARTQMAQEAVSKKYEQKSSEEGMASKAVDLERQRLQVLYEQGRLSGDQLDSANRDLELIQRQIDYRGRLNEINERYETKKAELDEKLQTSGDSEYLAQQVAENERLRARDTKNLQDTYNAQQMIYDNMENFTRRQKGWSDAIENYFSSMADAMIDWAKTGKFSSKELFNQLIEDIARYEMRLLMHEQWMKVRKPIMDLLSSAVGSFGGWFSKNIYGPQSIDLGMSSGVAPEVELFGAGARAKGMSYMSGGLEYFAKGGTFSNSIVNSPTLFKAAKGLGVMGEAGPEAIMPLKRDSNGVLGVRGGSSNNVEVVVNNYSSERAVTKETTDSRGNKKIEVIVGEAVASQISKTGSAVQRSMGGAYGLSPQLIRR